MIFFFSFPPVLDLFNFLMGSVRSFSSFDAICYPQLISAVGVAF